MLNLSVLLEDCARETPDRDAVVYGDMRLQYSFINTIANQVAGWLAAQGIGKGDKVALACPNLPYFPMAYFGILKTGATVVPLNVLLTPREITYHLTDSDAKAFICFEGTPELPLGERGRAGFDATPGCKQFLVLPATALAMESPHGETIWAAIDGVPGEFTTVQTSGEDTAVILYTSGTTGQPKGAELSHQNMLVNAMVSDNMFERSLHDTFLVVLPLFHSFGQTAVMNVGLCRAATLVLLPRFEAEPALELMRKEKVNFIAGVPTMYWGLLKAAAQNPEAVQEIKQELRVTVSGGSAMPLKVLNEFEERFGTTVLEGYGLSETSPVASFNRPNRPTKAGSIGLPIWGVEMKLVDEKWGTVEGEGPGEIAVRGHNVMKGYYARPEESAEVIKDGWFRTGDIARRDDEGYYYIIDRAKDMIIRGGFNVYPREIEEVLITHPEISLAAVVGVPHESLGEEVKACVIRTPEATLTEDDLIAWCKERLAAYKYPRIIEFTEELPMTATGKILKRELR